MNNIGLRLPELINALGLKKGEFADLLNISPSYVTKLISGKGNPSDRVVEDICQKFNVNEEWLNTGNGDMFVTLIGNDEIATYVSSLLEDEKNPLNSFIIEIMRTYSELDPKSRQALNFAIDRLMSNIKK